MIDDLVCEPRLVRFRAVDPLRSLFRRLHTMCYIVVADPVYVMVSREWLVGVGTSLGTQDQKVALGRGNPGCGRHVRRGLEPFGRL